MSRPDFTSHRLFVDAPLSSGVRLELTRDQGNYLVNVLRLKAGARLLVFNGAEGEWTATLQETGRKAAILSVGAQTRQQTQSIDLHYVFAPIKHARLDFMVQKAVEMGVSRLQPVISARTQAARVNLERMRANVIEAAEQCGVLSLPDVKTECRLETYLDRFEADRALIFCDEAAETGDPAARLRNVSAKSFAVLVGPEGGFDERERARLAQMPQAVRISLGPRILRADTAAVAALALVQATLGDWR